MKSNLIPITRIYDIYPKYTYSKDVRRFMDEIVDIDRANVFTNVDMVGMLEQIRAEIEQLPITDTAVRLVTAVLDKHKAKSED